MIATLHMTDKVVENMVLVMSPLLFAAWIGFALTSINLVPAWQLDGGHLCSLHVWRALAQNYNICRHRSAVSDGILADGNTSPDT